MHVQEKEHVCFAGCHWQMQQSGQCSGAAGDGKIRYTNNNWRSKSKSKRQW
jgi:hypothetical protein